MGKKLGLFYILLFMAFAITTASADNIVYLDPLEVNLPDCGTASIAVRLNSTDAIGGSPIRTMERILGTDIWTVSTNAVIGINLTHNLTVNVTDNKGNYNNSIGITLTVLRRGDVYRDNNLDYKDVLYIARYLASLPPECDNPPSIMVGDVVGVSGEAKGDGIVDLLDALYIARYDAGMEGEP